MNKTATEIAIEESENDYFNTAIREQANKASAAIDEATLKFFKIPKWLLRWKKILRLWCMLNGYSIDQKFLMGKEIKIQFFKREKFIGRLTIKI